MNRISKTLIVVIVALAISNTAYRWMLDDERSYVYSTFTCSADRESILTSDDICAAGFREQIAALQKESNKNLFERSAALIGVSHIIDEDLRMRTRQSFSLEPPQNHATLELDENHFDFGNVSESRDSFVMKEFTIRNTGTQDLLITHIGTSCSCLEASIIQNEIESATMGRFSDPHGMVIRIEPNKSVRLRVTYDARVNSYFRGAERRYVYITSNDPLQPSHQITIDVVHTD